MTTFKEAQRVQSQKAARSKRFNRVPTEDQEQMTLMSWAHRVKYGSGRLSDYLFHILMVAQETSLKLQSLRSWA